MTPELRSEIQELIEENRARALWWMRSDYMPETPEAMEDVLRKIADRGNRATFIRARQLMLRLK